MSHNTGCEPMHLELSSSAQITEDILISCIKSLAVCNLAAQWRNSFSLIPVYSDTVYYTVTLSFTIKQNFMSSQHVLCSFSSLLWPPCTVCFPVPEVIDGNTLTATVVDLNAWVEYEFRVLAKNSVGVGEPSSVSVRTRTEDAGMVNAVRHHSSWPSSISEKANATLLCSFLKPSVFLTRGCEHGLCCVVPDVAPGNVGGGGGSRSELVITWEVSDQSYVLACY